MRIIATSDTHFPFTMEQFPILGEGDVLIHAGDLMYEGYESEWKPVKDSLAALPQKNKYLIPGNHDFHIHNYEGVACAQLRKDAKVQVTGTRARPIRELPNGMKMLGIPYVTGLPGWAYNVAEEWLINYLREVTQGEKIDVVVSHSPPYRILDAAFPDEPDEKKAGHYGSLALNKWFYEMERKPLVWIVGHIHESYGSKVVDGCHFYNVAMCDRDYKQVNEPTVINL